MRPGVRSLIVTCLVVAAIWLIALPRIARHDRVRETIKRNHAAGIDPDAMFYSDLETMTYSDGVLRRSSGE